MTFSEIGNRSKEELSNSSGSVGVFRNEKDNLIKLTGDFGVILGAFVSTFFPMADVNLMRSRGELSLSISPGLMIFGLTLDVLIGVISGVVPAYRASKLKPVDALRYE